MYNLFSGLELIFVREKLNSIFPLVVKKPHNQTSSIAL